MAFAGAVSRRRRRSTGGVIEPTVQIALAPPTLSLSAASPTGTVVGIAKNRLGVPTGQAVYYNSSDATVASVSPVSGVVTWHKAGTATIYGTLINPAATHLVIATQPAGGIAGGGALTTQPIVEARSAGGVIDPSFVGTITATLASGSGSLTGTTSKPAVAGAATFTDLALSVVGNNTITFSASGLASVTSNGVAVVDIDNISAPTLGELLAKTIISYPDLSAVTSMAGLAALGFRTGNPADNTLNDFRNDRTQTVGANQVITDGPGGAHGFRVQFDQHDMVLVGSINASQTTLDVDDSTGLRDPAIWTASTQRPQISIDSEYMTVTAISATSGPATLTVVRGAILDGGGASAAATHANGAAIAMAPQESHNFNLPWADTLCGPRDVYSHYWERVTSVNYPIEKIDQDRAHRLGTKGEMWFYVGGDNSRSQFNSGYEQGSRYGMPGIVESPVSRPPFNDSGTCEQYYGSGGGGTLNGCQCRAPWPAAIEGQWSEIVTRQRNHSAPGARDGYAYKWKNGVLIIAVAQPYVGRPVPGAVNTGFDAPPKWCAQEDVDSIQVGSTYYNKNGFYDARAVGSHRVTLDIVWHLVVRD